MKVRMMVKNKLTYWNTKWRGLDRFTNGFIKACIGYFIFIGIILIIFKFVFMVSLVPSGSMEPTISTGSILLSTRNVKEEDIRRYDIMIFDLGDVHDRDYVKRVIGLPGETVEVKEGHVYVNGEEIDNSFVKFPMNKKGDGTYVVPEGCFFFLGDNRNNSKDSRFWEEKYVPFENIQAKVKMILFPFKDASRL